MPKYNSTDQSSDHAKLYQALEWIALDLPVLSQPYDGAFRNHPEIRKSHESLLNRASQELFSAFCSASLILYGYKFLPEDQIMTLGGIMEVFEVHPKDWSFDSIDFWNGNIRFVDGKEECGGYIEAHGLFVKTADLYRVFPLESAVKLEKISAYTTPYIELMQQAIKELQLSRENQMKVDSLKEWFLSQKIDSHVISKNEAKAMASFVRLPKSKKGGNKPFKKG